MRLSELFAASQGAPVEVDGRLVHMMYEFDPITVPSELVVERLASSDEHPEGIRLKARGGKIVIEDEPLDDVVLWSDTAPPEDKGTLEPDAGGKPMTLRAWNVWRDPQGAMQAWIGDAGMIVEQLPDGSVTLHCSDGFDEPSFDDIVVNLAVQPLE